MPPRQFYCGTRDPVPVQYLRLGSPYECLRTGVGVGKAIAEGRIPGPDNNSSVSSIILVILFMLCFAFLLFRT